MTVHGTWDDAAHGRAEVPDPRRGRRRRRGHPAGHRGRSRRARGPRLDVHPELGRQPPRGPADGHRGAGHRHGVGTPGRDRWRHPGQRPVHPGGLLDRARQGAALPALPRVRRRRPGEPGARHEARSPRSSRTTPATGRTSSTGCSGGSSGPWRSSASATWPGTSSASTGSAGAQSERSMPPSTGSITPVTKDDAGLSRNAAAAANSAGSPVATQRDRRDRPWPARPPRHRSTRRAPRPARSRPDPAAGR